MTSPADPRVPRRDTLVEMVHGVEVADPYRWMEDLDAPELRAWVTAMADEADAALAALPGRDILLATLHAAQDVPRCGAPWRRGRWWFHSRNTGLQDHAVLWCAAADPDEGAAADPNEGAAADPDDRWPPTEDWRVLLDPNGWDGARSLGEIAASPDGELLAYAVSEAGSDWQTWSVVEVATGTLRDDTVPWSKFAGAAWLPDGSGFLTCVFDEPTPGEEHEAAVRGQQVVLHELGGATTLVHALPDEPDTGFDPQVSHDGRWLLLTLTRGTDPETRLHVAPITDDGIGEIRPLLDAGDAAWWPLGVMTRAGVPEVWCLTDDGAPRQRVVAVSLHDGDARREVLAEGDDQLEEAHVAGAGTGSQPGWLVTLHLHHAASRVTVHDLAGRPLHEVDLGALVSAGSQIGGEVRTHRRDGAIHVVTTGFDWPSRLLRHDPTDGTTTARTYDLRPEVDGAAARTAAPRTAAARTAADVAAELVVSRAFVASGGPAAVDVPVFLVRRADVTPTGRVPSVLWGYGGFGIAVTPHFRVGWRAWVAHGGLLAVACLRGGSEYGRGWYDDGRLANKQRVFDDALAVAGWLCGEGNATDDDGALITGEAWTSPAHLGIEGRSNGGLLAAACLTQAPERFGSVVPEVGVLDLLRFHRFTIGWAWTSDYGDPETAEGFRDAYAYSPLHRVSEGTVYPPTLITTGDTDDRVVPSHSFKFAAALRHAQTGAAPITLRVDRAAGHGAGKPTSQLLLERADVLAWHAHHLGLDIAPDA